MKDKIEDLILLIENQQRLISFLLDGHGAYFNYDQEKQINKIKQEQQEILYHLRTSLK